MATRKLTLRDVRVIARKYVPKASRSEPIMRLQTVGPAHEIGHLLIAARARIGQPDFGMEEFQELSWQWHEEFAATIVETWIVTSTKSYRRREHRNRLHGSIWALREAGPLDRQIARRLIDKKGITRKAVSTKKGLAALCAAASLQ